MEIEGLGSREVEGDALPRSFEAKRMAVRCCPTTWSPRVDVPDEADFIDLLPLLALIRQEQSSRLGLAAYELAETTGMSRSRFAEGFKMKVGKAPLEDLSD